MVMVELKELVLDVTERVKALKDIGQFDETVTFDLAPTVLCAVEEPIARIYMFHGLRDGAGYWQTEPAKSFVDHWVSAGAQVVLPTLPYAELGMFRTGGEAYLAAYLAMLDHLEGMLPSVPKRFIGGISWGGYHAMLAAASQDVWDGYFAVLPVAKPGVLREFWYLGARSGPQVDPEALGRVPGFVCYGDRDYRADWRKAAALVKAAGIDAVILQGRDHSTFGDELSMVSVWLGERLKE